MASRSALPVDEKLDIKNEWRTTTAKVADVDALGATDPRAPCQGLMDMAEEHNRGLSGDDCCQQCRTPPFESPRDRVVRELWDRGWNVRAQDVDLAQCFHLGSELLVGDFEWRTHRTDESATNKANAYSVNLNRFTVKHSVARAKKFRPH